ncbi:hypothetical protein HZ326_27226 [Fusarium oxysporum f. sp. albedinis]|nr:hypothetical protein HZ326_27226 [Fusarium oxysporum f. sp. albedinis]
MTKILQVSTESNDETICKHFILWCLLCSRFSQPYTKALAWYRAEERKVQWTIMETAERAVIATTSALRSSRRRAEPKTLPSYKPRKPIQLKHTIPARLLHFTVPIDHRLQAADVILLAERDLPEDTDMSKSRKSPRYTLDSFCNESTLLRKIANVITRLL